MVLLRVPVVLIYDFRYLKRPQRPSILGTWTLRVQHYTFHAQYKRVCHTLKMLRLVSGPMAYAGINQSRILYKVLLILNSIAETGNQVLPSTWRAGAAFVLRQRSSPPN